MFQLKSITLQGDSQANRLLPAEADVLFKALFQIHDHSAARPAVPIFWMREPEAQLEAHRWSN